MAEPPFGRSPTDCDARQRCQNGASPSTSRGGRVFPAGCLSGKTLTTGRKLGKVYSSPIAVGDRIYLFEDSGICTVIAAGPEYQELARNELGELVQTTPAVSDGQLFVRGETHLFCVGQPSATAKNTR